METVAIIILCFICALLVASFYVMIRNHRVYKFQDEFVKRRAEYEETDRMIKRITSKSYERMVFSFKPLKLEYWYSEEEIAFIKKGMKLWKNRKS